MLAGVITESLWAGTSVVKQHWKAVQTKSRRQREPADQPAAHHEWRSTVVVLLVVAPSIMKRRASVKCQSVSTRCDGAEI